MAAPERNALAWLWLSVAVLVLDQLSKQVAITSLKLHVPVPVVDGLFNWMLTYNYGAAFSFLAQASGWQRWFFSGLAVGISALLVLWLRRVERRDWRQALPFALIIGGALGNLVDRLRFGYVVDFVDLYWGRHHWPAFNLADSAIVVGALLLILFGLRGNPSPPARSE